MEIRMMKRNLSKKQSRKWTALVLSVLMLIGLMPIGTLTVSAEEPDEPAAVAASSVPDEIWVEPSETNGLPVKSQEDAQENAQISLFKAVTGGTEENPTYTYELYLPGNAVAGECFFSWNGEARAEVDGTSYESGVCPVPSPGTENIYTFVSGEETLGQINVRTYQGSADVQPIFIDIHEEPGHTIADMDSDPDHRTTCSGNIYIAGNWHVMNEIKGRGNYSWLNADDKRPYNVKLADKIKVPGVDSKKSKKWSLLSEVGDHSLLRNRTGLYLARELGIGIGANSTDVWMNGEYQGCYTISPKDDYLVTDDGYMVENDNYLEKYSVEEGGDPQFALEGLNSNATGYPSMYNLITVKEIGDNLLMKDGVIDKSPANQKAVAAEIQAWLQDAWDAIRSEDGYNSKGKHYSEYIDVESFACMYLMHEYVKSWDVCSGSLLFHRDGQSDSDKLIAGPMWDLDNTLGLNADDPNLGCMYSGRGAYITEINEYHKTSLLKTLGKHAEFMDVVKQQYAAHQSEFDGLTGVIDQMANDIEASARMNHFKVNDLPEANQHSFSEETVLEEGTEYEQTMLATTDSKTDWDNYVANLKTYVAARSLWFENNSDFLPCQHDQKTTVTAATLEENGSIVTRCTSCGTWSENKIIRSPKMFSVAAIGYNGSEREPAVTVKDTAGGTIAPSNYTVTYANNINVGEANATVTFTGEKYTGSKDLTFTIDKGENPLKIKGKKVKVKRKALKKKAKKLAVTKVITFTAEGQGPMTYKKISGNKKLKINKTTGTVKVKKGLKKGTYKMKVKVKAAGNENYKASNWQKVTIKVKVK